MPGTFAPMYQELASGNRVALATSLTCSTHASCAGGVGSIDEMPLTRRWTRQSLIQSTCCSIDTIMLLNTDGLPGPVTVKKLGKPTTLRPR